MLTHCLHRYLVPTLLGLVTALPVHAFWPDKEESRLIFFAVVEGLYTDGVQNDVVDAILDPGYDETFVYACPICSPTWEALRVYRNRWPFDGLKPKADGKAVDTLGDGLDEEFRNRILNGDKDTRRKAVGELVSKYVERRLDSMNLSDEEKKRWLDLIQKARDLGSARLEAMKSSDWRGAGPDDWKDCSVCEGAVFAAKKR